MLRNNANVLIKLLKDRKCLHASRVYCSSAETVREVKRVPKSFIRLLTGKKGLDEWPSPNNIKELTLQCSAAGVSLLEIERYLVMNARASGKKASESQETNFYSKHLLQRYLKNPQEIHVVAFLKYFEEKMILKKDKVNLPIKRYEYVVGTWRLLLILEQALAGQKLAELQLINSFGALCSRNHNLHDLSVLGANADLQLSQSPSNMSPDVRSNLVKFYRLHNFNAKIPSETSNIFPKSLQMVNYEQSLVRLLEMETCPWMKSSIMLCLSSMRWKKSNFSESLQTLSEATFVLLEKLASQAESPADKPDICKHLCSVWMEICTSSCKQQLGPALEYLNLQASYFNTSFTPIGILPSYLLYIAARENNRPELKESLESNIPTHVRNEKFERCFTVEGMTVETKTFFIDNFISTTIATHQQAVIEKHLQQQQQEEKAQQTEEDKVKVIPKTVGIEGKFSLADEQQQNHHQQQQQQQQQLPEAEDKLHPKSSDDFNQLVSSEGDAAFEREILDIKLLEAVVVEKDVEAACNIYLDNVKAGMLPNEEATKALCDLLLAREPSRLGLLYRASPDQSTHRDRFYAELTQAKLRELVENWDVKENQLDAWIQTVELYLALLSDRSEGRVTEAGTDRVFIKCRQIIKLFIESNVVSDNPFEVGIRSGGLKIVSEFRDAYVLLCYWEALFFSNTFEPQQRADKIMKDFPVLVGLINIDSVIQRAEKFKDENIFRRLLEMNLRHPETTTDYHKSRSFEALLRIQTQMSKVTAGEETIKTAKTMDIRLTADYMLDFVRMKESRGPKTPFTIIADYFRRPK